MGKNRQARVLLMDECAAVRIKIKIINFEELEVFCCLSKSLS
jgi:hypothetical protein